MPSSGSHVPGRGSACWRTGLTAPIGMHEQSRAGFAPPVRRLQCLACQFSPDSFTLRPARDTPAGRIHDRRQRQPSFIGGNAGDVAEPRLIDRPTVEAALEQGEERPSAGAFALATVRRATDCLNATFLWRRIPSEGCPRLLRASATRGTSLPLGQRTARASVRCRRRSADPVRRPASWADLRDRKLLWPLPLG